jgi:hypothetical protein
MAEDGVNQIAPSQSPKNFHRTFFGRAVSLFREKQYMAIGEPPGTLIGRQTPYGQRPRP